MSRIRIETIAQNIKEEIIGKYFTSNNGYVYKVEEFAFQKGYDVYYQVRFLADGYITFVRYEQIKAKTVANPYVPSICKNNAALGEVDMSYPNMDKIRKRYEEMMKRVFDESCGSYQRYGGSGITIDPAWLIFENYFNDVTSQKGFHPGLLCKDNFIQMDKDYLQIHLKEKKELRYSKYTSMWLLTALNAGFEKREAYKYKIISRRGAEYFANDFDDLITVLNKISPKTAEEVLRLEKSIKRRKKNQKLTVLNYTIVVNK